jgi:hypothetical protein
MSRPNHWPRTVQPTAAINRRWPQRRITFASAPQRVDDREGRWRQGVPPASVAKQHGPDRGPAQAMGSAMDMSYGLKDHISRRVVRTPSWTSGVGCGALVSESMRPRDWHVYGPDRPRSPYMPRMIGLGSPPTNARDAANPRPSPDAYSASASVASAPASPLREWCRLCTPGP